MNLLLPSPAVGYSFNWLLVLRYINERLSRFWMMDQSIHAWHWQQMSLLYIVKFMSSYGECYFITQLNRKVNLKGWVFQQLWLVPFSWKEIIGTKVAGLAYPGRYVPAAGMTILFVYQSKCYFLSGYGHVQIGWIALLSWMVYSAIKTNDYHSKQKPQDGLEELVHGVRVLLSTVHLNSIQNKSFYWLVLTSQLTCKREKNSYNKIVVDLNIVKLSFILQFRIKLVLLA